MRAWDRAVEQDLRISSFCDFEWAVRPWPGRRRHVVESARCGPLAKFKTPLSRLKSIVKLNRKLKRSWLLNYGVPAFSIVLSG